MADHLTRLRRLEEHVATLRPPIDVKDAARFIQGFGIILPKPGEDLTPLLRFASWFSRHPPRHAGYSRRMLVRGLRTAALAAGLRTVPVDLVCRWWRTDPRDHGAAGIDPLSDPSDLCRPLEATLEKHANG